MKIYDSMYFNVSFKVFNMAVIFEKILGDIEGNRSVPCWQMEKKRS